MNLSEFYSKFTHANQVTGCVIWDGDMRKGAPIASASGSISIPVRKFVYDSINGPQPYRTKYDTTCENPRCVKLEHITISTPEERQVEVDLDKLREAVRLRDEGYRLDKIGEKMGIDPSTVSKLLKHSKKLLESEEGAIEQGG